MASTTISLVQSLLTRMDKATKYICVSMAVIACVFFAVLSVVMFNGITAALTATWAVISGVLIWDTVFPPKTKEDE